MRRPPEVRIDGTIKCRECKAEALTLYTCTYRPDGWTSETSSIKCPCGYTYASECTYGKKV